MFQIQHLESHVISSITSTASVVKYRYVDSQEEAEALLNDQ